MLLVLGIMTGTRESNGQNDSLCLLAMSELTTGSLLAFAKKEESAYCLFLHVLRIVRPSIFESTFRNHRRALNSER